MSKIVAKVKRDHFRMAVALKNSGHFATESHCPLALCLRESGYPNAKVYEEDIELGPATLAHTRATKNFVKWFDTISHLEDETFNTRVFRLKPVSD